MPHRKLKFAAIMALKQGHFLEAVKLWRQTELARSREIDKGCTGDFLVLSCAKCFEARLRTLSLARFDDDYGELANKLNQWILSQGETSKKIA